MSLLIKALQRKNGSGVGRWGRSLCVAAAILASGLWESQTQAKIIALFNFNDMGTNNDGTSFVTIDNVVGTPTLTVVEDSGPLADLNGQTGTSFTDADGTMHPGTTGAFPAAAWSTGILNTSPDPNDSWSLELNTSGYHDLQLRFDYRLTDAVFQGDTLLGPTQLMMEWAVGAGSFNTIQTFNLNRNNAFNEFALDLSGISELQNAAGVKLRGTWSNDGSETIEGGTAPSVRMDNLQVTGVPEPSSIVLLASVLAGIAARRRWRRS